MCPTSSHPRHKLRDRPQRRLTGMAQPCARAHLESHCRHNCIARRTVHRVCRTDGVHCSTSTDFNCRRHLRKRGSSSARSLQNALTVARLALLEYRRRRSRTLCVRGICQLPHRPSPSQRARDASHHYRALRREFPYGYFPAINRSIRSRAKAGSSCKLRTQIFSLPTAHSSRNGMMWIAIVLA
jgi:hypothetical protein